MSSLFSTPKMPKAPEPPAPMPVPDDEALQSVRRREAQKLKKRGGRESTILSDGGGTLGG